MSFQLSRRDYFKFVGGGAAGIAASGLSLHGLGSLNAALASEEVKVPRGPEKWSPSICSLCPGGCGLRVRTIGPRAVKIQGNPLSPVNQGGLCPKGMAGLQALYHPDRLRSPLKNVGTRTSPRWREISWEEAISTVVARLRRLRAAGRQQELVWIDRHDRGLWGRLVRQFLAACGSPNHFMMPSGPAAFETAVYLQQGVTEPMAYDLENTRYLLSFGVNLLEGWGSPVSVMRAFGRWRDSASGRRTKFVQIEPRLSITAARADEWVAVRPGAEAALALGIAYVLISEGLYDTAFVRDRTFGFEDWRDASGKTHLGFRSLVMSDYRLDDVATLTGVPAETILRVGREFGQNRPAVALGDPQTSALAGNPYAAMAVHSLNALVGSLDVPGGVVMQAELPLAKQDTRSGVPQNASHPFTSHQVSELLEALVSRRPHPVDTVLIHDANPVFSLPNGDAFRRALSEAPFIASFCTFLDETTVLSDVVLPSPTGLEKWQEAGTPPGVPYAMQAITPPVIPARHKSRHPGDVVLEIARSLGPPAADALAFPNFEAYLQSCAEELFKANTGAVFSTSLDATWNRMLERSGWWAPTYSSADELWKQIQESGGWWEPTCHYGDWDRMARTPSRRFEFYSQTLERWAAKHPDFAGRTGVPAGDDRLFLPHQPPLPAAPAGYPLLLLPFEVLPFAGGEGAHLPYLQQIAGQHVFANWDSWLEMHPTTARKLHVSDGDMVWIESRRGRARVRARVFEGARPDAVHLPLGYGHTAGSEWAQRGVNPLALIEETYEPVAGLPQTRGTYVKVYRT